MDLMKKEMKETNLDDLKCAPFGTYSSGSLLSSFPSCDWLDKEDVYQSRKSTPSSLPAGNEASLATSVLQKKETFFGSSENITVTTVSKVTTFANEDVKFSPFANFQGSSPRSVDQSEDEVEDFGEFARPPDGGSERPTPGGPQEADSASVSSEAGKEVFDDFGEFQGEKPKISKFDFLLATSQGKMKSSEEMIKSELATFDLSVQDLDDLKCAPFGTYSSGSLLSSFPSCDWLDKEDVYQSRKSTPSSLPAGNEASLATSVLQKKETFFGSSENITVTTVSKVTTFANEDVKFSPFANFQGSSPRSVDQSEDEVEDFGEFARPPDGGSERPTPGGPQEADSASVSSEAGKEVFDDFGEFQGEKPKISKFDFLLATSQGKMKSSEEMIKSELATFDLSVQGSHKRTLSLGSSPLPPVEQPFRDRSNTLSEKPSLPVIRDKYKDLTGEVEESERYAYEWQRCLESALQVLHGDLKRGMLVTTSIELRE
ncbi:PREDICTED: synergin gamma-like [Thamnophis sirtalis]|uniref:Synergin gamma-like n=1 Tax=Thamnophis sirtalis TaxID=35019 RepID=A0A6I9YT83_9SAUR|nr:PREDICTED: synergin gamma-like [Thamnophis sirtalis]